MPIISFSSEGDLDGRMFEATEDQANRLQELQNDPALEHSEWPDKANAIIDEIINGGNEILADFDVCTVGDCFGMHDLKNDHRIWGR